MEKSTVITLLIVVGLGGLALWYFMSDATPVGAQPVPDNCGGGVAGSIGKFIKGHTDRKNAAAPYVAAYFGAGSSAKPITDIAGKLSPSGYAEKYLGDKIGDWLCDMKLPGWGDVSAAARTVYGTAIEPGVTFGTSQLSAGTVGPVKSLYSAGDSLVHGNFGDAGKSVAKSVYEGPKAAYDATKNLLSDINPF